MKAREMPYSELAYWEGRVEALKESGSFTKQAWCDIGKELREKHGVSERVAVRIMHGTFSEAIDIEREEEQDGGAE